MAGSGAVPSAQPQLALQGWRGCATFPAASYDPETLDVLRRVFDSSDGRPRDFLIGLRSALAMRILAAAERGERDPQRLKLLAMGAIDA